MLQKLRSRHPIDLPRGDWGRKKGILAVLGGLAVLFVLIPFLLSPLVALRDTFRIAVLGMGAGLATLLLVLLVGGLRGKPGWQR